jgi:Transposase DDE domain group 1
MANVTSFLPGLSPVAGKSLTVQRDAGNLTSNGGLIVLREVARTLGIAERIARHIPDQRNPLLITHTFADMVLARTMMIAAGHEDCDDIDTLKADPAFKIACDRGPETGVDLMSQPTLSRLENAADSKALYKISIGMIDLYLDGYATPPSNIVFDIDDTDDPVYGMQEGRHFHGYYDCYCYLPLYVFCGRHLLAAKLRTSSVDAAHGATEEAARIVAQIRARWPKTIIVIRGDSGFCRDDLMTWCEANDVQYVLGLAANTRLVRKLAPEMRKAKRKAKRTNQPARAFADFAYRTRWSVKRRVIVSGPPCPSAAKPAPGHCPDRREHSDHRWGAASYKKHRHTSVCGVCCRCGMETYIPASWRVGIPRPRYLPLRPATAFRCRLNSAPI